MTNKEFELFILNTKLQNDKYTCSIFSIVKKTTKNHVLVCTGMNF